MALDPHSAPTTEGEPDDYAAHHPQEHPTDWGWHGEWGRWARVAGVVVALILLVMITTTHYNREGNLALILFAAALLIGVAWDVHRRRNSWRP